MKIKNELIVICFIFFILISISAVSAESNNTEIITINNEDDANLTINGNDILTDGNVGSFAELDTKINGDSSTNIVLDKDYAYASTDTIKTGIVINKNNTVIDGQGHTIDAKDQSRIFDVRGTAVTLKNIIFTNGHAEKTGGAIYNYGENLRILNCTFTNNTADSRGGAVYSYPNSYTVFVNSTFKNNKGAYGGALALLGDNNHARHDVINCTFIANKATADDFGGGAIFYYGDWDSNNYVRGSIFINNTANIGGAIYNCINAMINITDSIFLGNSHYQIDSFAMHVYADNNWFGNTVHTMFASPDVSEYINVTKWLYLDVIPHIDTSSATISINNVYDNQTGRTSTYSTSKLPSIGVKLNTVNATVESNNIKLDNTGKYEANLVLLGDATITANCENKIAFKTLKIGGLTELQILIRNTNDNSLIILDKDYVYMEGVDTPNHGIIITDKKNIVIDGNGHTINGLGKTILFVIDQDATGITFKNMNIVNGYSNGNSLYDGAGAYVRGYDTTFNNCNFINNTGDGVGSGGALHISTSKASVVDCKFINNTHTFSSGGAIYWSNDNAYIKNTLFENNVAENRAGAILLHGSGNVINCTFRSNTAEAAGAILHYGDVDIKDSTFISNTALGEDDQAISELYAGGGAIIAGNGTISNSVFINNTAIGGAAIFITSVAAVVEKSLFINNTVTKGSGVVFSVVNGGTVINSIFLNNNPGFGKIISAMWGGLKADCNWFASTDKNYTKHPDWGTAAEMTKWLFLNATSLVFNSETKEFETQLKLLEYDSNTENVVSYDAYDLPAIQFTLTGENVTFDKNICSLEDTIKGKMTNHTLIGEDGDYVQYDYGGRIVAKYGSFIYSMPFVFRIETSIVVNSTIDVTKGKTKSMGDYVYPFNEEYTYFLEQAGRVTYRSNNTDIVKVDKYGKITGVNLGIAEIYISFNGKDVMGRDFYTKSNATVIVNVTKIKTQIINHTSIPASMSATDGQTNIIFGWADENGKSISGGEFEYTNNNASVISIQPGNNNLFIKPITEGIANITIHVEGNEMYESATRTITFEVGRKTPELVADPSELSIKVSHEYWIAGPLKAGDISKLSFISDKPDVATLTYEDGKYVVRGLSHGRANITIDFAGDNKYKPAKTYLIVNVEANETSIKVDSEITLNINRDLGIGAYVVDSEGQLVSYYLTFASNDTSVATVDEYGVIKGVGLGKAKITINFPGSGYYLPSTAEVIVTVELAKTHISVDCEKTLNNTESARINAFLYDANNNLIRIANDNGKMVMPALNFISNDTTIVKAFNNGIITAVGVGKAKVTISYSGNENYSASSAEVIVNVVTAKNEIDVTSEVDMQIDERINLNATLKYGGKLNYISNDTSVATVDSAGFVVAHGVGVAEINVMYQGSNKFEPANEKVIVKVTKVPTSIDVEKYYAWKLGDTASINATLNPQSAGSLNFISNNESVVTVDKKGKITIVSVGKTTVFVSFAGNDKYAPSNATVEVTVFSDNLPTSIEVNSTIDLYVGDSVDIGAVLNPSNAGELTYISDDESVVKIDENGKLTAVSKGNATISIAFAGNDVFLGSDAQVLVTVSLIPTTIEVDKSVNVNLTESVDFDYVFSHPEAGDLKFEFSEFGIAHLENGKIVGDKIGKTNLVISFDGNDKYASSNATVEVIVSDVETTIDAPDSVEVNLTESTSIIASLDPKDAGKLRFTTKNNDIISIDSNGKVTGIKIGTATVTVSFAGDGKYRASSRNVTVVVRDVETTISSVDSINLNLSESVSIVAYLNPKDAGKLRFTTNNNDIIYVSATGTVTGKKVGTATVTVSFAGDGKYRASSWNVTVVVRDVETTIIGDDSVQIDVGETTTIDATLNPEEAGNLRFVSNDTSIVSVNSNSGLIQAKKVGTATITISYTGNGKYRSAIKNVTVNVVKADTVITVDVDDINLVYGQKSKINATITPNVGNLAYSSNDTSIVTVDENGNINALKPGVATITISYPGDNKHDSANKTVTVKVAHAPSSITVDEVIKMEIATGLRLPVVLNPSSIKDDLILTVNDTDLIEIQQGNYIFPHTTGTATLDIYYPGNEYYLPSNATTKIIVDARKTEIIVNSTVVIGFSETLDLGAVLRTTYGDMFIENRLHYVSSDDEIVSVDKNGVITANKVGNAVITIKYDGENTFKPSNATVNVEVTTKTTSIEVDHPSIYLHVDDNSKINATLIHGPEDYRLNYMVSDPNIVRVNPFTGEITALAEGTVVITIIYPGDDEYHTSSADVHVYVSRYTTHINAANSYNLVVYESQDLYAVVTPNDGSLTYVSSDESVVTVDGGILKGIKSGSAVVTIKFEGDRKYMPSQKEVIVSVGKIPTSLNLTDMTLNAGEEFDLGNIISPEGAPTRARYYDFISMNTEIFDVDNGLITTFQDGVAELYVEFKGNDIYLPTNKSVIVTVIKKVLEPGEYNVTVEVDDDAGQATFTFTLPEDAEGSFIVTLNGQVYGEVIENGKAVVVIDELEPGNYKANLRYGGDIKYASISNTTKFHVGQYKIDKNKDIEVSLGSTATYTVHLTKDTQAMENKTITFKVNGKKYYAQTDMLGYASIKVKLPASKAYTVTAEFGSVKVSNKIKVHVIVAKNLKAKKTKNLKIQVSLKKVNNKYLSNKKVTLKFNGKTYTAKTNKKAVATFTINKNALSKLKVGKSYNYVVKYAKDSLTKKITIKK